MMDPWEDDSHWFLNNPGPPRLIDHPPRVVQKIRLVKKEGTLGVFRVELVGEPELKMRP